MTQPTRPDRDGAPFVSNPQMNSAGQVPNSSSISVGEIEALLRSARENAEALAANEELGPGDVQYFRGETTKASAASEQTLPQGWFESRQSPDELLQRAEDQLADAMTMPAGATIDSRVASTISKAPVSEISSNPSASRGLSLEDLGNLDLDISIELGRTELLIEEVLKLREGSVVSLDKLAGDPVDIMANGRLVARGELLVIEGKFGVRLSEVL